MRVAAHSTGLDARECSEAWGDKTAVPTLWQILNADDAVIESRSLLRLKKMITVVVRVCAAVRLTV